MADVYRAFLPELEIRAASRGGDGRTVEGLAVPFGRKQRITEDLTEQFARGSASHQLRAPNRVKFARDHQAFGGALIGAASELRDDAAGLWGAFRVSRTERGDETLALIEDQALDELSVGFRERQNRRLPDGTLERVKVDIFEVAVVPEGAYGRAATVTGLRAEAGELGEDVTGCPYCSAQRTRSAEAAQILASLPILPPLS